MLSSQTYFPLSPLGLGLKFCLKSSRFLVRSPQAFRTAQIRLYTYYCILYHLYQIVILKVYLGLTVIL